MTRSMTWFETKQQSQPRSLLDHQTSDTQDFTN
jgi:hypothetical protein